MNRLRMYVFLSAVILTVFGLQWAPQTYPSWAFWIPGSVGILGLPLLRTRIGTILSALSAGIVVGICAVQYSVHVPHAGIIDAYADGRTMIVEGVVSERPDYGVTQSLYVLAVDWVETDGKRFPLTGKLLLRDRGSWPRIAYGGRLRTQGTPEIPSSSGDFRYDRYLSMQGIYVTMDTWQVIPLAGGGANPVLRALYAIRDGAENTINGLYGEPHSSLLAGLLTGARRNMPEDLKDDLKTTGLTHIIAISGFNITLLLSVLRSLLFWMPFRWRLIPSALAVAAFTLFVGASASVVRAAVMGTLGMVLGTAGRLPDRRIVFLWALTAMTVWNPKQFWYDPGFHLSFLALLGITEVSPLLEKPLERLPSFLGIRDALRLTLSAQIATAPWSALTFGQISLISLLSNLLAPPLVPAAMLFGGISIVAAGIDQSLGQLIGAIALLPLQGILLTARILAKIPYAAFAWKGSATGTVLAYAGMTLWIVLTRRSAARARPTASASPRSGLGSETGTHATLRSFPDEAPVPVSLPASPSHAA